MPANKPSTSKKTKTLSVLKKSQNIFPGDDNPLDRLAILCKQPGQVPSSARRSAVALLCERPEMRALAVLVGRMPAKLKLPKLDVLVEQAGIPPSKVVGALAEAMCEYGYAYGKVAEAIAYRASPDAMHTLAKQAVKPGSIRDRELLFRMTRHLPVGSGTVIQNSVQANAAARADTPLPLSGDGLPDEREVEQYPLPPFEESVRVTALAIRQRVEVA